MGSAGTFKSKFLASRNFAFFLAFIIVSVFLLLSPDFFFFRNLQLRVLDFHFSIRHNRVARQEQAGVTIQQANLNIHPDILILGIDNRSLADFGAWPFPRYRHADLLNTFSRIKDDSSRENSVFLDIFFIEPSSDAVDDAQLEAGMEENGRVFLQTVLTGSEPPSSLSEEYRERHRLLFEEHGEITQVEGDWVNMPLFLGMEPPLKPLGENLQGYGHANYIDDEDDRFRRQPMIARNTERIRTVRLQDFLDNHRQILSQTEAWGHPFARIGWYDKDGTHFSQQLNNSDGDLILSEEQLNQLAERVRSQSPPREIDLDDDGESDAQEFDIGIYIDHFIPSITLALAANYLNIPLEDIRVNLGEEVILTNPRVYNPDNRSLEPYSIQTSLAEYDEETQEETVPARFREMEEIRIPIDTEAQMLVNFMGERSSSEPGGQQTFPVRPYSAYARRATGPIYDTWPRTLALDNKIIMAGAFSSGLADDEKTTGVGLMYGIELHANALNTILMDKFITPLSFWPQLALLSALVLLVAVLTGRVNTFFALALTLILIVGLFIFGQYMFESNEILVQTVHPSFAMVFSFLSVVIYRGLTEEREKRRVQGMFGQYVSPEVVDEIMSSGEPPELGGVDKELTVFFSDIRGFTTLSEKMQPQELVNHLNIYLTAMTDTIMEYKGTLDKYVGDEIMGFWGAPVAQKNHAILACQSAVKQMQKLRELNEQWPLDRRIDIGMGINSGIMTVGNMGSRGRMNYTLMGDNVNLGARLEGINKQYFGQEWTENGQKYTGSGSKIIISEYTYGLVKDKVIARELDNIRVKGKNKPVVIYELIDISIGLEPFIEKDDLT